MFALQRFVTAGCAAGLALSVAACGTVGDTSASPGNPSGAGIVIAGVYGNTSDPFFSSIGCGARAEAQRLGVELKTYTSASLDTNQFAANFQSAQLAKPNGIFVEPFNANQFVAQYQSLMQQGVPIVTASASTPPSQYKLVLSSPDTAPYLPEALSLIDAESGSMVVLGGAPGVEPLEIRYKPFVEAVTKAKPGLTALPTEYSGFDINKSTSTVASLLIAHPDLRLVIASNGPDGQAAAAAVQQAGKAGQVKVIAFDAVPAEIVALKAGTITALIAQAPQKIGAESVSTLVAYIKGNPSGRPVPSGEEVIGIPQRLLTAQNVDDPANADYIYRVDC